MNQLKSQGQHCPYLVVAAFPGRMPQIIGRTYNRVDAEAHVRFLRRRMMEGSFFLVFDPGEGEGEMQEKGEGG